MATVHGSWLRQGFFVLGNDGLMQLVRDELDRGLGLSHGTLRIRNFPVAANWKHTYWWREGDIEYAEAQFFAQIAQDYAVLSLGLSVEKGYENPRATAEPGKLMDRRTWDWPRLMNHVDALFVTDVVATAEFLQGPVNVRMRSKQVPEGAWRTRTFSFSEGSWFERHVGRVEPEVVSDHVRELDRQQDSWAIIHFAHDLGPIDVDGLSPAQIANTLLGFDSLRRRLRGALSPGMSTV